MGQTKKAAANERVSGGMADFDIVELRERYKLVCQGFASIPSDLKREYEEVEGFVQKCLELKEERFTYVSQSFCLI